MRLAHAVLWTALAVIPLAAVPAASDPLLINEILAGPARDWDGSGTLSSRDDEWVELMNLSSADLDLSSYYVTDGDSIPRYRLAGTLASHGYALVTGRMAFDWERANGFPAFGLSLANGGDGVILWHIDGADTVEVDRYDYRSHEAVADRSIGRRPDGGVWSLFDGLNPYTGAIPPVGNGCDPTPGGGNACQITPVHASTWGAVKRRYR